MKLITTILLFVLPAVGLSITSTQGNVIQVSRRLRMSNQEPLPPKEYLIDLGQKDGLKVGTLLEVSRRLPVLNGQSGTPGPLVQIPMGLVRVTAVGESGCLAVATEERRPNEIPMGEPASLMLGDEVRVKQAFASP